MVIVPRSFIPAVALPPTDPFASASVDLNFATGTYVGGSLGSLISVTNSSGGYVTNADGTLTSIAANTPRIGVGTGLLVEESRTNIYPDSLSGWSNTSWQLITLTTNNTLSPDGATHGALLQETTANGSHSLFISLSKAASVQTYAATLFMKPVSSGTPRGIGMYVANSAYSAYCNPYWDANGNYVGSGAASGFSVVSILPTVSYANGWFRIGFVFTTDTDTSFYIYHSLLISGSNTNYTGDGVSGTYVFGPQVELGSFPTSYIATTGSTATRQWDNVTSAGALTTALNGAASVYMETSGTQSVAANSYAYFFDAVTSGQPQAYFQNVGQLYLSGTGGNSSLSYTGTPYTGFLKSAFAWDATGSSVSSAGLLGTISAAMTLPSTGNWAIANYSSGSYPQDGYIPRLAVWNSRLPDTTLTGLTT